MTWATAVPFETEEPSPVLEACLRAAGSNAAALPVTEAAMTELRRIDEKHLLSYAENFERQAAGHPEIKTRLVVRLAALLRALAAEQRGPRVETDQ